MDRVLNNFLAAAKEVGMTPLELFQQQIREMDFGGLHSMGGCLGSQPPKKDSKVEDFAMQGAEMVRHPRCLLDVMGVKPRALPKARSKDGQELDPRTSMAQKQFAQPA